MLRKLLKHEFRATGRIMGPLYLVVLAISLLGNGSVRILQSSNSRTLQILGGIVLFLYGLGVAAVFVMTLVVMVRRFRTNLLGDEGYVMFTLPATVHQHVWSKILVSTVWTIASVAVVCLSMLAITFNVKYVNALFRQMRDLLSQITAYYAINGAAFLAESLLLVFVSCAAGCLMFYAAMAVGHSFAGHKTLLSVVFFFAFFIALQFLGLTSAFSFDGFSFGGAPAVHAFLWLCIGEAAAVAAVFYVVTTQMLKKHLNLE